MRKAKTIWTIMKKEFSRFFKDKRLIAALFLPGVLIYCIYSLLGGVIAEKLTTTDEDYVYQIRVLNAPDSFEEDFAALNQTGTVFIEQIGSEAVEGIEQEIVNQEKIDLLVKFPENFLPTEDVTQKQPVTLTYNSAKTESATAVRIFSALLESKLSLALFVEDDKVSEEDMTGMIFSMIAPMLLLVFLFTGCSSIAPESIAGEKERGTLGAMLVTPVKRSHIALGKILSLSALSLLSGVCSFFGLVLSLPKLMQGTGLDLSSNVYTFSDYAMILAVVLSSVLLIVALLSVLSAFSKSVKEATSMIAPINILVLVAGLSTMFTGNGAGRISVYLIPIYNSARALYGVFSFEANPLRVLVTVIANVVWAGLLSVLLTKMFDNERIAFNK